MANSMLCSITNLLSDTILTLCSCVRYSGNSITLNTIKYVKKLQHQARESGYPLTPIPWDARFRKSIPRDGRRNCSAGSLMSNLILPIMDGLGLLLVKKAVIVLWESVDNSVRSYPSDRGNLLCRLSQSVTIHSRKK